MKIKCVRCSKDVEPKVEVVNSMDKASCPDCGNYIKFLAKPLEEAIQPFGVHKGELLVESVPKNMNYYKWLVDQGFMKGILKERIETLLGEATTT